jgi:hypothetical protein
VGLDVGSLFGRAGLKVDDDGFARFERKMDGARRDARNDVEAHGRLDVDRRGFDRYERNLAGAEKSSKRFGIGAGAMVAGVGAAAASAAVGVGIIGKAVVSTATDINESLSKNNVLFGKYADGVEAFANRSARAFGISKSAALEATGTFGNLFVALEIGPKKAADMSVSLTKLAADLASFNNASPEEALEAIRSGLVGETEPLRRFGVNLNDASLRTEALRMGLVKNTKEALDPQTKALAVNALLFKQTEKAQGDFSRTSSGLANQLRIAKAQISDLGGRLGQYLLPIVGKAAQVFNDLLGRTDEAGAGVGRLKRVVQGIGAPIRQTFNTIVREGGKLVSSIRRTFTGVEDDLRRIARGAQSIAEVLLAVFRRALPGIRKLLEGLAQMLRGVIQIIAGILTLDFGKAWEGVKSIFAGAIKVILGNLRAVTAPFREVATRIGNAIRGALSGAFSFVKRAASSAADTFLGFVTTMIRGVEKIVDVGSKLPLVGDRFDGLAKVLRGARRDIDQYRESLRDADRQASRQDGIRNAREEVRKYRERLKDLKRGSDDYKETAERLKDAQRNLNKATRDSRPAAQKAGRGFAGLKDNVNALGDAESNVFEFTRDGVNSLLKELGVKPLNLKTRRFIAKSGHDIGITSDGSNQTGGWAGDGPPKRFANGGWLGGSPNLTGPDNMLVAAAPGEGFVTRHQRPAIEFALAFANAMGVSPYGSMGDVFDGITTPHMQSFARGGLTRMIAAANKVDAAQFPYLWGGGHSGTPAPFGPFDCSGAVSYVLQQGGVKIPTSTSGTLAGLGQPGPGAVTVYADPVHTFMTIKGRGFGTSAQNPGGGAGWFEPGAAYMGDSRWSVRHFPVDGTAGELARLIVSGGTPATRAIVQGSADKLRKGANSYLDKQSPLGGFGDVGDGGPLSSAQVKGLWTGAGGPVSWATTMDQIAFRESRRDPAAIGGPNSNGTYDHGLWQINDIWARDPVIRRFWSRILDAATNARAAVRVFNTQGPSAWSTYQRGGLVPAFAKGGFVGQRGGLTKAGKRARGKWGSKVDAITGAIENLGQDYELKNRRFDFTEEEFINEGDEDTPPSINTAAVKRRAKEVRALIRIRKAMLNRYRSLVAYLTRINRLLRRQEDKLAALLAAARKRLSGLAKPKTKEAKRTKKTLEERIEKYRTRLSGIRDQLETGESERADADYERRSTAIDVTELQRELRPLLDGGKGVALPEWEAPEVETPEPPETPDVAEPVEPEQAAPDPLEVAKQAAEMVRSFQAQRQDLFSQYGSNFETAGRGLIGGGLSGAAASAALAAGLENFGALGGGRAGAVGQRPVQIVNNFATVPPDPHTWARQQAFEVQAAF